MTSPHSPYGKAVSVSQTCGRMSLGSYSGSWCSPANTLLIATEEAVSNQMGEAAFERTDDTLQWRHNECHGISNHQPLDCSLNRLFGRRSKKTSKLRVTGLCVWNLPGNGEFPTQRASKAENVSIWWRHHEVGNKDKAQHYTHNDIYAHIWLDIWNKSHQNEKEHIVCANTHKNKLLQWVK